MNIVLTESQPSDMLFLREMLYEAVFWRQHENRPSAEEALAYPEVSKALADFGRRDGDTAVVAAVDSIPVGAAWYRFWNESDFHRGYVDEETPVLAIGVRQAYRHQGVGKMLLAWLIDHALKGSIQRLSLAVSKDNYALDLYRQQGFQEYADTGDSFIMVRMAG